MSWIAVGSTVIGAVVSSRSASKATDAATAGAERGIEFARESRDLARGDQAPYREAGVTALDALMSMTGLGGGGGSNAAIAPQGHRNIRGQDYLRGLGGGRGGRRISLRYGGGPIYGREHGGTLYNVNEMGPESVYQNGSYTRSNLPQTIPPNPTGYVAPNIQGRALGGGIPDEPVVQVPPTPPQGGGNLLPYQPPPNIMNPPRFEAPPTGTGGTTVDNNTGLPVGGNSVGLRPDVTGSGVVPFGNQGFADGGAPQENPGGVAGGYNFMTDPGYNFRIGEGQRALSRGAAAAGGLLSGGYGRRLTRYAQDYASNEYTNVYNRISNIAGLGQVSAQSSGNAALIAGGRMGGAASDAGNARASGYSAQGDIWGRTINSVGGAVADWWENRGGGG